MNKDSFKLQASSCKQFSGAAGVLPGLRFLGCSDCGNMGEIAPWQLEA
jgi:hypothetical protein